ncbi:MAG: class I SAM-dependent methyltransferase, partial [Gammaproteobacteria bacterium]|nr:class I SAM-dependent methyltransferase [Gammaproteobacteria bacterium]
MAGAEHAAFDAGWLSLREPVDHRSRSASLIDTLVRSRPEPDSWRILDLGSGTGSNFRYIAPRIPAPQAWTLLDRDAALLEQAGSGTPPVRVRTIVGNLASEGIALVAGSHLVTASALLDLVSRRWLTRLITCCRTHDCAVLFSLTYDGEICWHASPGSRPARRPPRRAPRRAPPPRGAQARGGRDHPKPPGKGGGPA